MKLGIEASNIKAGGGLTHLKELLAAWQPAPGEELVVYAGAGVLAKLPEKEGLRKGGHPWLDKGAFFNMLWRILVLPGQAAKEGIRLIFSPGGNWLPGLNYVSMSQNMLVFESRERNRFPSLKDRTRYRLLELKQLLSFFFSRGILFISGYARDYIFNKYPGLQNKTSSVVYHGVADRFGQTEPKPKDGKVRFLYVSILNYYKHQDVLIQAFSDIRKEFPQAELILAGPSHPAYLKKIGPALEAAHEFVSYKGMVPHEEIHKLYAQADAFIFSSTCENMPNILVEAMRSGLPVLCSSYGPMPEILGKNGLYFDPVSRESCAAAIRDFMNAPEKFRALSAGAAALSAGFTWQKCADETFAFLRKIAG